MGVKKKHVPGNACCGVTSIIATSCPGLYDCSTGFSDDFSTTGSTYLENGGVNHNIGSGYLGLGDPTGSGFNYAARLCETLKPGYRYTVQADVTLDDGGATAGIMIQQNIGVGPKNFSLFARSIGNFFLATPDGNTTISVTPSTVKDTLKLVVARTSANNYNAYGYIGGVLKATDTGVNVDMFCEQRIGMRATTLGGTTYGYFDNFSIAVSTA